MLFKAGALLLPFLVLAGSPRAQSCALVHDINPGMASSHPKWRQYPQSGYATDYRTLSGSALFLSADDGRVGSELWKLEHGRLQLVRDINPAGSSEPQRFTEFFNGRKRLVLFEANDGVHGFEPWITDGTRAGTRLLKDIYPGRFSSMRRITGIESYWCRVGQQVFFVATDPAHGQELWVTNGTTQGTRLVKDIDPNSSSPLGLTEWRGRVVFRAFHQDEGVETWISDGTAAGTRMLVNPAPGPASMGGLGFTELNGDLYYTVMDGSIWSTDGTQAGTRQIPGPKISAWTKLVKCNGRLLFTAINPAFGSELFAVSGSPPRITMVKDIVPGGLSSEPHQLVCTGSRVLFGALGSDRSLELWSSQGTAGTTVRVARLAPANRSDPLRIHDVIRAGNDGAYFALRPRLSSSAVWFTDGTSANTQRVCDITPRWPYSTIHDLTVVDGRLVFRGVSNVHGSELYEVPVAPRAHVMEYGYGCTPHRAELRATNPVLGTTTTVSGTAPRNAPGVVLLGDSLGSPQPLLNSSPCALHLDVAGPVAVLGSPGSANWTLPLPIPNDPRLTRQRVDAQALYLTRSPVLGASSNGIALVLGR